MTNSTIGPQTAAADRLHAIKYRAPGEDFREAMNRIAFTLKDNDKHYHEFREIIISQRFLPAGRIQAGAGSSRHVTLLNCFASGTIADSFVDGAGSIMDRAKEAAATMRMGGGIGYDFSTLRPRGEMIAKLQSHSSGPISFMNIFNAVCQATSSSGHRRGAQMGILRVDHPDIEEFIHAKNNSQNLLGFNISIAVTDEFMTAALTNQPFDLRWSGRTYRTIDAAELWENIMRSTYDWAEPGVLFIDTINQMNNLWYAETIAATNPCSEQPLPPFGACLLGSFNLCRYLTRQSISAIDRPRWSFDFDQLTTDIPIIVRAMDNVVDKARYPLAEQRAEALTKRRLGIGITGLANTVEALGHPYGSTDALAFQDRVMEIILIGSYEASSAIAEEKGPFPLFDAERYLSGHFVHQLPEDLRQRIKAHGLRNSHLTSIAPTGTISLTADNVSSSIEPPFFYTSNRPINTPDGPIIEQVEDYGKSVLGVEGTLAADVTVEEHINVLLHAQKYVDSAVSKTVNMDGRTMTWQDFKSLYKRVWEGGGKGCSTFNATGKRMTLISAAEEATPSGTAIDSCEIGPDGRRSCE